MNKGFTLLELIVVIVIVGILATLGFTQYVKTIEKGRSAEARMILGQIRSAEEAYNQEWGAYGTLANLPVDAPTACNATAAHYFSYAATTSTATATRCTASGKTPTGPAYSVTITNYTTGAWGGTAGY